MYKILFILVLVIGVTNANSAKDTCNEKINKLNKQIEIAEQFGNSKKIDGLKKALKEIKTSCNDESIKTKASEKISKTKKEAESRAQKAKKDIEKMKAKNESKIKDEKKKASEKVNAIKEILE